MKTRIIHTKVWTDSFYLKLKPIERYLFLYFLSNPHVNIIHCYECPDVLVSLETGVSIPEIQSTKTIFQDSGKILFFKDYVFLRNAHRYETYSGELNEKSKRKLAGEMSVAVLDWYNSVSNTPIYTPLKGSITHNTEQRTYNLKNYVQMNEDIDPNSIPI